MSQPAGDSADIYEPHFCGACMDNHAEDGPCLSKLEQAVIDAAIGEHKSYSWRETSTDVDRAVDALLRAREDSLSWQVFEREGK